MARLHIIKLRDGQHELTLRVPIFMIHTLLFLLPEAGRIGLAAHGIELQAILDADKEGQIYSRSIDVSEKGVSKRVIISLQSG